MNVLGPGRVLEPWQSSPPCLIGDARRVGEEYAAADRRHQHGAGVRRSARAGGPAQAYATLGGATLRIQDSLQTGTSASTPRSHGCARSSTSRRESTPLLFLLDEMLNGTNSRDRRTGAEAVLGWLVGHGAIGLVATHDLALSQIADALAPRAENVHFEDDLEDGRIRFDYVCRPGIMTRSNALELMRAVGLDVGPGSGAGPLAGSAA